MVFSQRVMFFPHVCPVTCMCLYDVSKPTKLSLVREVKDGDAGKFKRLSENVKTSTTADNLKLWLTTFFQSICDIMSMCEYQNGSTNRYLPSWFTTEIVLNEYINDTQSRLKGNKYVHFLYRKSEEKTVRDTFIVAVINNCDHKKYRVVFNFKKIRKYFIFAVINYCDPKM